jgi:hypothetical protein
MQLGAWPLLDRAARYFPIAAHLERHVSPGQRVLEVGSGPFGIAWFRGGAFVGTDVVFELPPVPDMMAVRATAGRLPFRDGAFDAVVMSDVLEHVAPAARRRVLDETLRVAGRVAVIAFPCGPEALAVDVALHRDYLDHGATPPQWLAEHVANGLPDASVFDTLPAAWRIASYPNETLRSHARMMRRQRSFVWRFLFRAALLAWPRLVRSLLRRGDREPCYRRIFVLTRA